MKNKKGGDCKPLDKAEQFDFLVERLKDFNYLF
jgi:hypothetical protein